MILDLNDAEPQKPQHHRPKVDPVSAFEAELSKAGYKPGAIVADGDIQRFDLDRRGDKTGWYWLALDGVPAGGYGDWKSGLNKKWSAIRPGEMTAAELADVGRKYEAAKKAREAETIRRNEAARIEAARIWDQAQPAPADHPYLISKNIQSYDLKIDRAGRLLVPMLDSNNLLWSLQRINPDGSKRFLSGGAIKGNFYTIPGDDQTFIVEGFATGASIAEATGGTIIVAFNSGNLKRVAKEIRKAKPGEPITICADNDQFTKDNPGVKAANEAAAEVGARVVVPHFTENLNDKPTDFNDLARAEGPQAVKDQIEAGTESKTIGNALSMLDFRRLEVAERAALLHPWLKEESINLLYGWRGAGKTWFALSIGDAITKGGKFGKWECHKPAPCLYLDGEMTIGDNQERIDAFNLTSDRQQPFYIYCEHYANQKGSPRANLNDIDWRADMKGTLLKLGVKVWIVDNIASLAPGLDENVRQDWDPINQWLLDLRFNGITTILLHHEGKTGKQRGTSAREDNLDISIQLQKPGNYKTTDGARFITNFEKARIANKHLPLINNLEFKLDQDEKGRATWTIVKANADRLAEVLKLLDQGMIPAMIATTLNVVRATVTKDIQKAKGCGYLDEANNLQDAGRQYIANNG